MSKNEADILELEKELAVVETGALEEEKYNAEVNYGYLANEMMTCKNSMPYPDVGRYDVGIDYEERDALHYKKGANKPFYDEIELLDAYYNHNNGSLYSGHVSIAGKDYYIMDSGTLESKQLNGSDQVMLINADDDRYRSAIKGWRYPATNADITLSRNIFMKNKLVNDVDVVYDRGNTAFSGITDAYLRKALIRNKTVPMAQSIIQTIQKKQDEIRLLPAGTSFIAQGCAGSGKTMVLLHRILITPPEVGAKGMWTITIFVGGVLSVAGLMASLGVSTWLAGILGPILAPIMSSPWIFIPALCIITYLLRFVIVSQSCCMAVMIAIFGSLLEAHGINIFVLVFTSWVSGTCWNVAYQNPASAGLIKMCDPSLDFATASKGSYAYCIINLIAMTCSVPLWMALGLL